jgi:membrane protease YdiL (CAAX protease family)
MPGTSPSPRPGRPLSALLALLLFPLTAGLLLAPHVYNILRILVKHHPDFRSLHPLDFAKVANRCILVVALLVLVPLFRRSGLGPEIRRALRGDGRLLSWAGALAAGLLSMGLLYAAGMALGGYRLDLHNELSAGFLIKVLLGATFIGVFEEAFFRGFVYGALRTRTSVAFAAVVASLFFAALHFAQPVVRSPRWADWDEGMQLLALCGNGFDPLRDWPYAVTLFLMGLTLCVIYQRTGHLAWCVGLHAGWVLAMQLGNQLCDRDFDRLVWLFTQSGYVGQGLIATPVMGAFFLWSLTLKPVKPVVPRRPVL